MNAYFQGQINTLADPTTDRNNLATRIFGVDGKRDAVLALLFAIADDLDALVAANPAGSQKTPAITISTDGSESPVAAGKQSVGFSWSSDFAGTIQGAVIDPTKVIPFSLTAQKPDTLGAIAFTVTAGQLFVAVIP